MSEFRLPYEIPEEDYPPPSTFAEEAVACVDEATKEGIILRVMAALGIYLHSPESRELGQKLGRPRHGDIDFVSYGKFRSKLPAFFEKRNYKIDRRLQMYHGKDRHMYFGGKVPMVEVFFEKIQMNHTISFNNRLEEDSPTIPLSEMLLQKLQIVQINEKDIKDVVVMLRAHDVGRSDKDMINLTSLTRAGLASDWGFWYDATTNLKKVKEFVKVSTVLTEDDRSVIDERLSRIVDYIEQQPKTWSWKMRAGIGTKRPWYNEVEDWKLLRADESAQTK